jgi:hypothetical protein
MLHLFVEVPRTCNRFSRQKCLLCDSLRFPLDLQELLLARVSVLLLPASCPSDRACVDS